MKPNTSMVQFSQFRRQQHAQMNDRDQRDIGGQRARQRQDRLPRGVRRQGWRDFRLGFQGVQDLKGRL